ncbi:hypothetical protein [Streptomyces olivochromogenes]
MKKRDAAASSGDGGKDPRWFRLLMALIATIPAIAGCVGYFAR